MLHSGFKNGLEEPSKFSTFPRKGTQTIRFPPPPVGAAAGPPRLQSPFGYGGAHDLAPAGGRDPLFVLDRMIGSTCWLELILNIIFLED